MHYYRRLRLFTQANAGALDIASLDELLLADEPAASPGVLALAESTNFDGTHRAIANLRHAADFSPADLRQLVWAAEHNNQVSWILGDSDVHTFYQNIVRTFDERLAPSDLSLLNRLLSEAEPSDE
ncbi:MAG: hypothetical protein QF664_07550 [Dehalococcoidia bacterium]|nr:hypothetical protein [Dehalococcoidia bacterium]